VRLQCLDALVDRGLVRLVRAVGGDLDIVHELAAGGFDRGWGEWGADGVIRLEGGPALRVAMPVAVAGGTSSVNGRWLVTRFQAPRGMWVGLTVGPPGDPDRDDLVRRLVSVQAAHDRRLATARLPRHHPERGRGALAVLQACRGTRGCAGPAPTTRRWTWREGT
jgi:hypothetical protein